MARASVRVSQDEVAAARAALARRAGETQRLLAVGPGPATAVPGSRWTVGEIGSHLLIVLRGFAESVRGNADRWAHAADGTGSSQERLAAFNDELIGGEPRRDVGALGELIVEATEDFLAASEASLPEERMATPWYGPGATLPVSAATCLLLGEQVVHGYDIAQALGAPWPISPGEACLVFHAVAAMMPVIVDPAAAAGVHSSYDIRLRGGQRFVVRIEAGTVHVEGYDSQRVDCRLSADPEAFLLVVYGRTSQWRAIGQGKVMAWGRRPWLGLRLKGLFQNP